MNRTQAMQRRLDELYALPITPENPDRLQGPEAGTLHRVASTYGWLDGQVARVIERSYVWGPDQRHGETRGHRRYDWSVIEYGPKAKTLVIDDADLVPLEVQA